MNILILGPQGSGKGTQARLLSERLNLFHLEMGEMIRKKAEENSPLGRKINEIVNVKGKFLPDGLVFELFEDKLNSLESKKGIVFDGFPRSVPQFVLVDEYLKKRGEKIDWAFFLTLSEKESLRRLSLRRVCEKCGANFNLLTNPPQKPGICDFCGGRLVRRKDDMPEKIKTRLREYKENTLPLISLLRQEGILREINGEQPIETIYNDIICQIKAEEK